MNAAAAANRWTMKEHLSIAEKIAVPIVALLFVAAGLAHYYMDDPVIPFVIATAALAGMAWLVSFATEQVGEQFGPATTGLLQSTLGNLPEFFIVVFALQAGQTVVATTSLVGSILGNALLVLGLVLVVGAWKGDGSTMKFSKRLPNDTATLTLLSVFTIVLVSIAVAGDTAAADNATTISLIAAGAMMLVYGTWVVSYIRFGAAGDPIHHDAPRMPLWMSIGLLAVAGSSAAFVAEWFVAELEPAIETWGISEAFAGLVIVAIAGNAVENATGVILAWKNKPELAISVVKNSVAQISAFLYPALVLVSAFMATQLTFEIDVILVAALVLTAIIIWQVTSDGIALVWEGAALIAIYIVIATTVWFL